MFIFDIFNFKKSFEAVATKENFNSLREIIKAAIIAQVKSKIPGEEKMNNVINEAIAFINTHINSKNEIVQWIIDHVLIAGIRGFAQAIYEDLKQVVKGL